MNVRIAVNPFILKMISLLNIKENLKDQLVIQLISLEIIFLLLILLKVLILIMVLFLNFYLISLLLIRAYLVSFVLMNLKVIQVIINIKQLFQMVKLIKLLMYLNVGINIFFVIILKNFLKNSLITSSFLCLIYGNLIKILV